MVYGVSRPLPARRLGAVPSASLCRAPCSAPARPRGSEWRTAAGTRRPEEARTRRAAVLPSPGSAVPGEPTGWARAWEGLMRERERGGRGPSPHPQASPARPPRLPPAPSPDAGCAPAGAAPGGYERPRGALPGRWPFPEHQEAPRKSAGKMADPHPSPKIARGRPSEKPAIAVFVQRRHGFGRPQLLVWDWSPRSALQEPLPHGGRAGEQELRLT